MSLKYRAAQGRRRVVFNGRFLAQVQTGVQRYGAETLRALDDLLASSPATLERVDWVLAVPHDAPEITLRAIRLERIAGRGTHLWEQGALWRFTGRDFLVNFNYSGPLLKRNQLITIHDATVRVIPQAFSRSYRWVHNTMVAVLGRRVQSVMTISAFSRDELRRWFGLTRNDIVIGREGGEHAVLPADDDGVLRRYGLVAGRYILGVGSVKPNKNYGLVGQAMQLIPAFPWPVVIAGARDISIFSEADVLPKAFHLLGFVPDDELAALYRHAACFVFPSLYEGFGLPAVEAMANGCPVLAARVAAIPEVCGDAALYFDPTDAASLAQLLRRVVDEPQLRDSLRPAVRACLARNNWRANAQILLDHLLQ